MDCAGSSPATSALHADQQSVRRRDSHGLEERSGVFVKASQRLRQRGAGEQFAEEVHLVVEKGVSRTWMRGGPAPVRSRSSSCRRRRTRRRTARLVRASAARPRRARHTPRRGPRARRHAETLARSRRVADRIPPLAVGGRCARDADRRIACQRVQLDFALTCRTSGSTKRPSETPSWIAGMPCGSGRMARPIAASVVLHDGASSPSAMRACRAAQSSRVGQGTSRAASFQRRVQGRGGRPGSQGERQRHAGREESRPHGFGAARRFLAALLGLHSRLVVGWATSAANDRHIVMRALRAAPQHRRPGGDLLHHSDQGSPYASDDPRRLRQNGLTCSMSRRGHCDGNAVLGSFFSAVKFELGERFDSHADAKTKLFDYLEVIDNLERRRSAQGNMNPRASSARWQSSRQRASGCGCTGRSQDALHAPRGVRLAFERPVGALRRTRRRCAPAS